MDLGLSPKAQAWLRVVGYTFGVFTAAYTGASSDSWISSTEWIVGIAFPTVGAFLASISGSPKDARPESGTRTRVGD